MLCCCAVSTCPLHSHLSLLTLHSCHNTSSLHGPGNGSPVATRGAPDPDPDPAAYNVSESKHWSCSCCWGCCYQLFSVLVVKLFFHFATDRNYTSATDSRFLHCVRFLPRNALKCICAVLGSHVVRLSVRNVGGL